MKKAIGAGVLVMAVLGVAGAAVWAQPDLSALGPLTPCAPPSDFAEAAPLFTRTNSAGETVRLLRLGSLSAITSYLQVGERWFALTPEFSLVEPGWAVSSDGRAWLLSGGGQLIRSDDGGATFGEVQPPGWGPYAKYFLRHPDADPFHDLRVSPADHNIGATRFTERLRNVRLGWLYADDRGFGDRVRFAFGAWRSPPLNSHQTFISHDAGRHWSVEIDDSGARASTYRPFKVYAQNNAY